eukprot:Pgem_evm1s20292
MKFFAFTAFAGAAKAADVAMDTIFPMSITDPLPAMPSIKQPDAVNNKPWFNDNEIIQVKFTGTPSENKEWIKSQVDIDSLTDSFDAKVKDCGVRRTSKSNPSDFYFKDNEFDLTRPDGEKFANGWDRFSIHKSNSNDEKTKEDPNHNQDFTTLCAEKLASDIANAIGYYPWKANYAAVYQDGKYKGMYVVKQRLREDFIKNTYGEKALPNVNPIDKDWGSLYSAEDGNLLSFQYNEALQKKQVAFEQKHSSDHTAPTSKFEDLISFSNMVKTMHAKDSITEDDKAQLRKTISYDTFARAQVLAYYTADEDGYFGKNKEDYEWYSDVNDGNKWKLLLWNFQGSFQHNIPKEKIYNLYDATDYKNRFEPAAVLKLLLQDTQYTDLYKSILTQTANTVLPPITDSNSLPAYAQRVQTYWNTVTNPMYENIDRRAGDSEVVTAADLQKQGKILQVVSQASKNVIDNIDSVSPNDWESNVAGTTPPAGNMAAGLSAASSFCLITIAAVFALF